MLNGAFVPIGRGVALISRYRTITGGCVLRLRESAVDARSSSVMANSDAAPRYDFIAYIDEAGDPGISRVRPIDEHGSSEWITVSAVVIGSSRESELAAWNADLIRSLESRQLRELHFQKLSPHRKLVVCKHLATLPVRCFVVVSNKQNMRGWLNPFAAKIRSDNWFYCWMTRVLLERVTHFVRRKSLREFREVRKVKLVYSERGGLSYSQMNAYYAWLAAKGDNQVLTRGNLAYETMDMRLLEVRNHTEDDGLKLPDVVASAFFKAVDIWSTGACDPQFALALRPRMAISPGPNQLIAGYGVKLMPGIGALRLKTRPEQLVALEKYGYPEQWWH